MRSWRMGEIADGALWLAIILAPVAGGGASVLVMPALVLIVGVAYTAALLEHRRTGSRVYLYGLPLGLFALAAYTLLQIAPLPEAVLRLLSPRAHEVREFFDPAWWPISYEPAASAREVARLLIYGMVAVVAADRVRARKSYELVAVPVVIAGLASLAVAFVQRLLGAERMLGVLPSMKEPSKLLTTFVNPNHASAFLLLVAMTALGLAIGATESARRRLTFGAVAVGAAVGSVSCFSRGGLAALALVFVLYLVLMFVHRGVAFGARERIVPLFAAAVLIPIGAILLQYDELVHAFSVTEIDPLGVAPKIAAVKDALPLVLEHPLLGIGRGSYVSVYPAYKTAAFQLTFTHPENIAAQVVSDWGVLAGGLASIAFVACTLRRIRAADTPVVLAATLSVLVLTAQNLVDFNFEMPGMAILVAALLGGAAPDTAPLRKLWPKERRLLRVLLVAPIAGAVLMTAFAFHGDLEGDQRAFDLAVRERGYDRTTTRTSSAGIEREAAVSIDDLIALAARHPANPVMAAQISYLAETSVPPDFPRAMRWTNRTLLLAPTYADGHLAAGRMLIRSGHRAQGFMHIRRGWSLASEERLRPFIRHVVTLAQSPEELLEAVPRRDEALDVVDEGHLAACAKALQEAGKEAWARALLAPIDPAAVPDDRLVALAEAARSAGMLELAVAAGTRAVEAAPADARATHALLGVLWEQRDTTRMARVLEAVLEQPDLDPTPFLRMQVQLGVRSGDTQSARTALEQMNRRMPPTLANQVEAARLQAEIATKEGLPAQAVRALDRALQLTPHDTKIRFERARALAAAGRVTEAREDVEVVLRADPKHKGARELLGRLKRGRGDAVSPDTPGQN